MENCVDKVTVVMDGRVLDNVMNFYGFGGL